MTKISFSELKTEIMNNTDIEYTGPIEEAFISKAEELLELEIKGSYREFLKLFGTLETEERDVFGIIDDDFLNSSTPDAIWYTLNKREDSGLPLNYLVIEDTGYGELFCLDLKNSKLNIKPKVVIFFPGIPVENQTFEIKYDCFSTYLKDVLSNVTHY